MTSRFGKETVKMHLALLGVPQARMQVNQAMKEMATAALVPQVEGPWALLQVRHHSETRIEYCVGILTGRRLLLLLCCITWWLLQGILQQLFEVVT